MGIFHLANCVDLRSRKMADGSENRPVTVKNEGGLVKKSVTTEEKLGGDKWKCDRLKRSPRRGGIPLIGSQGGKS
jgi:hypothetical protein